MPASVGFFTSSRCSRQELPYGSPADVLAKAKTHFCHFCCLSSFSESERLEKELIDKERRIYGSENARLLSPMGNLADTLYLERKYAEAKQLWHEVLAIQQRTYGPEHPSSGRSDYNLGCVAAREGNRDEAFSYLNLAVDRLSTRGIPNLAEDPELNSLHGDSRFDALVARTNDRVNKGMRCPL
jgi:tetratricopeptide (TPR) repeat protein